MVLRIEASLALAVSTIRVSQRRGTSHRGLARFGAPIDCVIDLALAIVKLRLRDLFNVARIAVQNVPSNCRPRKVSHTVMSSTQSEPHTHQASCWFCAPPGRLARPALNVDLAWTPLCLPKLGAGERTKRCRFFHRPWPPPGLDSLVFTLTHH